MKVSEAYHAFLSKRANDGLLRTLNQASYDDYLDFSSNDSLNLSRHPKLITAAKHALDRYGMSISGARLLCKHQALYAQIEQKIAQWVGSETALLFNSGYIANSSALQALLNPKALGYEPEIFCDKAIHASLHEGIKLAGCKQKRFAHQDLIQLKTRLEKLKSNQSPFIVVESLYGMTGSKTDFAALEPIAHSHQPFIYVDEAHAFGLYGPDGAGLTAKLPYVHCRMGNFGKALGGYGGFIACSQLIKDYLMNHAPGFIYSTALPPAVLAAQMAALELMPSLHAERQRLAELSNLLITRLKDLNLAITSSQSHIVGIEFNLESQAREAYHHLLQHRIKVSYVRPPTVPKPMLRISLNCKVEMQQLNLLVDSLEAQLSNKKL